MKQYPQGIIHFIFFSLLFLLVSWFFHYFEIFHYAPYGMHRWRQTDSLSFVQTYYNNGMHFFEPKVHLSLAGNGNASPSEFPILYYLAAWFWKIFEPHDGTLRVINILILATGLFSISKLTLHLTKDIFYSLMPPFLLMGSPVIAFYGFNYLPNAPALGLVFSGILCFYYFFKTQKRTWLLGSWVLFLFAGLLKVTALIPFIVIIFIFLLEKINWISFKSDGKIFQKGWWNLPFFLSIFIIIAGWIYWVSQYNELHGCGIFITRSNPIWALVEPAITETWHWIIHDGVTRYYHIATRYFVFGMMILLLFFLRKKQPKILYVFNLFIFLGVIGAFFTFYRQFFLHDYYAIEMMTLPATVFVSFFYILKKHYAKVGNHILTRLLILAFLLLNLHYAQQVVQKQYSTNFIFDKEYDVSTYKKHEVQAFLKNLGIEYPTKVISIPDESPNFTLNYFNLLGWSELGFAIPLQPKFVKKMKEADAEYLIITDKKYLKNKDYQPFLKQPLGSFENTIFVFKL